MAYPSPENCSDLIYDHISHAEEARLPQKLDLSHLARPPRNQGPRGTCAAIAGAAIREIHYFREHGKSCPELSPEFIYYNRQTAPASGMFGRDVFRILSLRGVCPESDHTYGDKSAPSRRASRHAKKYKISTFARICSPDALKQALYNLGPCFISLPKYSDKPRFWRQTSRRSLRDSGQAGHAVVVIGYNKKGFILQNSWGDEWNGSGRTVLPYKEYSVVWEAWVPLAKPPSRKGVKCI